MSESKIEVLVCSNMHCLLYADAQKNPGRICPHCGSPLIDAPEWEDDDDE